MIALLGFVWVCSSLIFLRLCRNQAGLGATGGPFFDSGLVSGLFSLSVALPFTSRGVSSSFMVVGLMLSLGGG